MFTPINPKELMLNPPTEFGDKWMLLCAGNQEDGCNAMTIAWGHLGALWELQSHSNRLPTAIVYVRPSRYTKTFMDSQPYFTLSVLPKQYKRALGYMGSHSGREEDKIAASGLTPIYADGTTYFEEADTVYILRKLYQAPLVEEGFVDKDLIEFNYPERDFHEMYIGEIVKVLQKKDK